LLNLWNIGLNLWKLEGLGKYLAKNHFWRVWGVRILEKIGFEMILGVWNSNLMHFGKYWMFGIERSASFGKCLARLFLF